MANCYFSNNAQQLAMMRQTLFQNGRNNFVVLLDDIVGTPQHSANQIIVGSILLPDLACQVFLQDYGDRIAFENCYREYLTISDSAASIDELIALILFAMIYKDIDFIFYQENGDKIVNVLDPRAFTNVLFDHLRYVYGLDVIPYSIPQLRLSLNPAYSIMQIAKCYQYGFIEQSPQQPNADGLVPLFTRVVQKKPQPKE